MTPREIDRALIRIANDARNTASTKGLNIRGYLSELNRLRSNLAMFGDIERTTELARRLPSSRTVSRSQQTRGYLEKAQRQFDDYRRLFPNERDLSWALGWLHRALLIEEAFGSRPTRPGGQSGRGTGRPFGNRGRPRP